VISTQTRQTRVIVARLDRGEDVAAALLELARWHRVDAGLVRGQGILDAATLGRYDPPRRAYAAQPALPGPLELAALCGTLSLRAGAPDLRLHAVLAGADGACHAGLLLGARAFSVEVALDALDEADLERQDDPATGLAPWRTPSRG
jgi:predicted DNA-binding protein with PD1-like motif